MWAKNTHSTPTTPRKNSNETGITLTMPQARVVCKGEGVLILRRDGAAHGDAIAAILIISSREPPAAEAILLIEGESRPVVDADDQTEPRHAAAAEAS